MYKILFICHGNICRSPMAEFVFKDLIAKKGIKEDFFVDSVATSNEEQGNELYYLAKKKLNEKNIPFTNRKAKRINSKDYDYYDLLVPMEEYNIKNLKRFIKEDKNNKIHLLLDFTDDPRDVADPWYTGDFDKTYNDIVKGCNGILKYLGY